ncbi:hypothetical protein [Streptomyces milbemycinicus]|uniref:Uncharacterized protein n=1 Tax=Streptomyces milbemycinicus TaxID=476552 RepID=A0ABW8LI10_9ACTN
MAALQTLLVLMPKLTACGHIDTDVARRQSEEVLAALEALAAPQGMPDQADLERVVRRVTPEDRALLGEGLRVIEQWVRQPGEETGRQVDDVVARMRRELGPLIARDRAAEETADRERLRASVRESISRRLREARADNDAP